MLDESSDPGKLLGTCARRVAEIALQGVEKLFQGRDPRASNDVAKGLMEKGRHSIETDRALDGIEPIRVLKARLVGQFINDERDQYFGEQISLNHPSSLSERE